MGELEIKYKWLLDIVKGHRSEAKENGVVESYEHFDGQVIILEQIVEDLEKLKK